MKATATLSAAGALKTRPVGVRTARPSTAPKLGRPRTDFPPAHRPVAAPKAAPKRVPRITVPGYCAAESSPGAGLGSGDGDGPPVRLKSAVIEVPECPRGYHGRHEVKVGIGGAGFPLVIAHGYTSHSRVYLLVLGLLGRWFKVIGVDLAGHGGTAALSTRQQRTAAYADLLLCTMDHLGIEKAVMVGHSLGGRVAAEAVSMQPARAAALLLANSITGSVWDEQVRRLHRNPGAVLPLIGRLVKDTTLMVANINKTDPDFAAWVG